MITREDIEGKAVTLGMLRYAISFEHGLHQFAGELLGEVDHTNLTIKLSDDLNEQMILPVFLHECYHAMVEQTGTKLTKVRGNDEGFADRFSFFFANMMYDNPWLLKAIISKGKFA